MTDVELNWTPSEVETQRSELERTESALASAMAENEALKEDLTAANKRIANQIEQIGLNADQIHRLQRELAQVRNERDTLNGYMLGGELGLLSQLRDAERARDNLRNVAEHILALFDSGNVLGTIAAIPGLREALDGGT